MRSDPAMDLYKFEIWVDLSTYFLGFIALRWFCGNVRLSIIGFLCFTVEQFQSLQWSNFLAIGRLPFYLGIFYYYFNLISCTSLFFKKCSYAKWVDWWFDKLKFYTSFFMFSYRPYIITQTFLGIIIRLVEYKFIHFALRTHSLRQ